MSDSFNVRNRLTLAGSAVVIAFFLACFALFATSTPAHADNLATEPDSMTTEFSTTAAGDYASTHQNIYRLYNKWTNNHLYTPSLDEAKKTAKAGWQWEGIGWVAPTTGDPVYRLYNPYSDDHHYTTSKAEYDKCVKLGWRGESVGWYSDTADQKPLLRQFNPYEKTGTHNFTISQDENDSLVKKGWRAEGTAWYATNGSRIPIKPFWLKTPAWGKERLYWVTANGTFAKNRVITAEEGGYMAWAGSNGVVARNTEVKVDGKNYWADDRGELTPYTSPHDLTLQRAKAELDKVTNSSMSKAQKLRAAFNHIRDDFAEYNPRIPHMREMGWDTIYANDIFVGRGGNCISCAAAMAYMAKAAGYENVYACNSGGHGWAEVDGLVYDPEWARHSSRYSYYGMSYDEPCDVSYRNGIAAGHDWNRVKI